MSRLKQLNLFRRSRLKTPRSRREAEETRSLRPVNEEFLTTSNAGIGVFRRLLKEFILKPALDCRLDLALMVSSLLFIAIAQGLAIVLIKGFLGAFFLTTEASVIRLSQLVPDNLSKVRQYLDPYLLERSQLTIWIPLAIVFAGALKAMSSYLYGYSMSRITLNIGKNYREKVFQGVMSMPWVSSSKRDPGEWMSVIMTDSLFVQSRITDFSTAFIKDVFVIVSCTATLAFIHWPAALVIVCLLPIIGWNMGRAGKRISWYTEAFQRELGVLSGMLLGMRERFRYIRAQGGEDFEYSQFQRSNHSYLDMMKGSIFIRAIVAPGMEWVGFTIFAVFIFGWTRKLPGFSLSPDVVVQFFVALGLILKPIRECGEQISRWGETIGGLKRSFDVLNSLQEQNSLSQVSKLETSKEKFSTVQIQNLDVGYGQKSMFHGQNLEIGVGKSIAVIGPSGGGKSTLLRALSGLVTPQNWEASLPYEDVVAKTSFVSQTPFMFKDSIRANLLYGLEPEKLASTSQQELIRVLGLVKMEAPILRLEQGLDTLLNPLALNFSGGQLQRLVVARALLRGKSLLLFDEATSSIDEATERDLLSGVMEWTKSLSCGLISVTHRLQWLSHYDEIWFVERGRISLKGSYKTIMSDDRVRSFVQAQEEASS